MFTKFYKRLHKFQKSKPFRLHAISVVNFFHCCRLLKSSIFFLNKNSLKNIPCPNIRNNLVKCCYRTRPVYIESRVCVVKDVVKCSFQYLCVVHHDMHRQHNVGVRGGGGGGGGNKKNS